METQWTDEQIHDAAEAYEDERRLWRVRSDKYRTKHEVIRTPDHGSPQVMVTAIAYETALYELEISRSFAAMRAALAKLPTPEQKP